MLSSLTRRVGALLALLAVLVVATASPAAAEEQVVRITNEGVMPRTLTVAAGDTIRFVNESMALGFRAVSTSENWSFDSGPVALFPGRSYTVPGELTEPGTYTYRVADGAPFMGSVVVPAPAGQPAPAPAPAPAPGAPAPGVPAPGEPAPGDPAPGEPAPGEPAPGAEPAPGPPGAEPAPGESPGAASGGTGAAALPPLTGSGFGSLNLLPQPDSGILGPAPALAPPLLPGEEPVLAPPLAAAPPATVPLTAPAIRGALPGGDTARDLGLPVALAMLLAAGVGSLIVRLLLAEPAARRRFPLGGSDPLALAD